MFLFYSSEFKADIKGEYAQLVFAHWYILPAGKIKMINLMTWACRMELVLVLELVLILVLALTSLVFSAGCS